MGDINNLAFFAATVLLTMVVFFFLGKNAGSRIEKSNCLADAKTFEKKMVQIESSRNELERELENIKRLNE